MSVSVLNDLVEWYEHLTPARIGEVGRYYADDARFIDPFNDVVGVAAIGGIFAHMFDQVHAPQFKVEKILENGAVAMLVWRFEFAVGGKARSFQGATELQFNPEGKVVLHRDYWDPAREIYSTLPLIGGLFRWLARRLQPPQPHSQRLQSAPAVRDTHFPKKISRQPTSMLAISWVSSISMT